MLAWLYPCRGPSRPGHKKFYLYQHRGFSRSGFVDKGPCHHVQQELPRHTSIRILPTEFSTYQRPEYIHILNERAQGLMHISVPIPCRSAFSLCYHLIFSFTNKINSPTIVHKWRRTNNKSPRKQFKLAVDENIGIKYKIFGSKVHTST